MVPSQEKLRPDNVRIVTRFLQSCPLTMDCINVMRKVRYEFLCSAVSLSRLAA